jgi:hypothetical protein
VSSAAATIGTKAMRTSRRLMTMLEYPRPAAKRHGFDRARKSKLEPVGCAPSVDSTEPVPLGLGQPILMSLPSNLVNPGSNHVSTPPLSFASAEESELTPESRHSDVESASPASTQW